MKSVTKMIEKIEHQSKVNPGHKTKYVQPARPRATVFKSKKAYNRAVSKLQVKEILNEN